MARDVRFCERCEIMVKIDVTKEGCEARIDSVDDDDEHEGLDNREAKRRSLRAGTHCANMIFVNQASKRESSTR